MIIGLDIGGTKTLLAIFAENGHLLEDVRFETNKNYEQFLQELTAKARDLNTNKAKIVCAAVPGLLDRKRGIVKSLGNLPWKNKPIASDISDALGVQKVFIENDSKLAGLGEVRALQKEYGRVYYITLSTGIGGTLLIDQRISQDVIDGEVGMVPFMHQGEFKKWEEIASGKTFFKTYGEKAMDVQDAEIWEEFSQNIGPGIAMICCIYQVEAIIFGGGLGLHLEKFKTFLKPFIDNLSDTIVKPQELITASHGDNSVIYGCYHYAKEKLT